MIDQQQWQWFSRQLAELAGCREELQVAEEELRTQHELDYGSACVMQRAVRPSSSPGGSDRLSGG